MASSTLQSLGKFYWSEHKQNITTVLVFKLWMLQVAQHLGITTGKGRPRMDAPFIWHSTVEVKGAEAGDWLLGEHAQTVRPAAWSVPCSFVNSHCTL